MVICSCAPVPVVAPLAQAVQDRPARIPPTLAQGRFGQAVNRAVDESPLLARSDAELDEASAQIRGARAGLFPTISVGLELPVSGASWEPVVSLTQLVFDAGSLRARTRAAEARLVGRAAARLDAASEATLEAVEAWAGVVTARNLLAANENSLRNLEDMSAQISARARAGAGSSANVLTARGRVENQRVIVAGAAAEVARAEAIFAEVFRERAGPAIGFPPPAPALPSPTAGDSPILLAVQAELLAAEADLVAARAGLIAPINVSLSTDSVENATAVIAADDALPISGRRAARVVELEARVGVRSADVAAARREVDRRIAVLLAERSAAGLRLQAAQRAALSNRESVTTARAQFDIARRSLLELLDTEREALAAETQLIIAERDNSVLGYALLAATGDVLDLFGIELEARHDLPTGDPVN